MNENDIAKKNLLIIMNRLKKLKNWRVWCHMALKNEKHLYLIGMLTGDIDIWSGPDLLKELIDKSSDFYSGV